MWNARPNSVSCSALTAVLHARPASRSLVALLACGVSTADREHQALINSDVQILYAMFLCWTLKFKITVSLANFAATDAMEEKHVNANENSTGTTTPSRTNR
jgi:hypothetical protein